MPSRSLAHWEGRRLSALDKLLSTHAAVAGAGRGHSFAARQVNQSCVVLLSSHFQAFCRDLHSEAADFISGATSPAPLRAVIRVRLTEGRYLDKGNPTPGNLGADFGRFGFVFWEEIHRHDRRNKDRHAALDKLMTWRNAIAHQDFTKLGPRPILRLANVRRWRKACEALASSFDAAVARQVAVLVGSSPW